ARRGGGGDPAGAGTGERTGGGHLGDPGGPRVRSRDRQLPDRGVGPRRPPRRPGHAVVGGAGEPVAGVSRAPGRRRRGPPAIVLDEAAAAIRRVLALASELGADTSAIQVDLASDPVTASYQIAALAPVDPLDGLAMLSSAGPASRLRLCLELLDDVAEDLREQ